jgi:predicted Zn-dependent protease
MKKLLQLSILKIWMVCIVMTICTSAVNAQQFDKDYTPLQSSGTLPEAFLISPRKQSEADIKKLPYDSDRNAKEQFIKANNYFLNDLLLSGQVLVNDPLTAYVNKVAAEVIRQNPSLATRNIQLFVTKSPEVNAYAFDKGFIFVNIGLLAQLENEAQLAYILSHEMIHIDKKHSVTEYLENHRSQNDNTYDRAENEERMLSKYRFSKDQERDADVEGLAYIKKTNYSAKAVMGAFDVLQYSYLPFELTEFKKSFLEDEYLKLPDTLILKKTAPIKTNDDYDDTKSTHPNIRKRRMSIDDDVKGITEAGRKKYLVSEDEFKTVREAARFELCRLYLLKRDYVNAIYGAYILLQKYPDNVYLKKIVGKGLYNIVISKSDKKSGNVIRINNSSSYSIDDYSTVEGASQRLYYLLENLNSKELNVIALSYVYKTEKQYPNDHTLSALTDSLLSCLVNNNRLYPDNFSKKTQQESLDTVKLAPVEEEEAEESKYAMIKKIQASAKPEDHGFIYYAFVGLLNDGEFVKRFSNAAKGNRHEPAEEYVSVKKNKNSSGDELLGIGKIIFIDPFYKRVQRINNDVVIKYEESDDQQAKLIAIQKKCANLLKLDYATISTIGLSANDMERYNESAIVNEWLAERFKHGNNDELMECSESVKKMINKLGTKYIALTGIYNSNKKNNAYFFMLLDLESGKVMRSEIKNNRARDTNDLINSYVYNSLMHVAKIRKN